MKTLSARTLSEFLTKVNTNRKEFGDMFVNRVNDQKHKMIIQFTKVDRSFRFNWDSTERRWLMQS